MYLTIKGLYDYNWEVFRFFELPRVLVPENAISAILMKCGDLELTWPDYDFMQSAIRKWSERNAEIWEKLANTISLEYNPLWNVDANITETDTNTRTRSGEGESSGTDTHSVKGYNSTAWSGSDKLDSDVDQSWNDSDRFTGTHTTRRTGNIGVTSTQELLRQEREVSQFNIYDYIAESFKTEFCIMVY